jgi:hypothetical protein
VTPKVEEVGIYVLFGPAVSGATLSGSPFRIGFAQGGGELGQSSVEAGSEKDGGVVGRLEVICEDK